MEESTSSKKFPDHGHKAFSDYDVFRNQKVPFLFLRCALTPLSHGRRRRQHAPLRAHGRDGGMVTPTARAHGAGRGALCFDAHRVEFADEVASFTSIVEQALHEETRIPGTSRWSLRKLGRILNGCGRYAVPARRRNNWSGWNGFLFVFNA